MRFRRRATKGFERVSVPLATRSIHHLSGEVRHGWGHSIAPMASARWSATFRSLSDKGRDFETEMTASTEPKGLPDKKGKPGETGRYPVTPDGRYFIVRVRLWRRSNPWLDPAVRDSLVKELMAARRAVGAAKRARDNHAEETGHAAVDRAKKALGERGPVWWGDGAPDINRHMVRYIPYAEWFAALPTDEVR